MLPYVYLEEAQNQCGGVSFVAAEDTEIVQKTIEITMGTELIIEQSRRSLEESHSTLRHFMRVVEESRALLGKLQ